MSQPFSFAHLADVHLGAYSKALRELNLQAFLKAMDRCVERKVDFVLIAGDLFHINVPDLAVVDRAAAKLREVKEAGVPVYVWYGSHDYSPTEKSIIDVLASSGLFTRVSLLDEATGRPAWTTDPSTGAKIVAVAGKALGLDRHVFTGLDKGALQAEAGFKIFGYHAAVREFLPAYLEHIDAVGLEDFPAGFDYYAGGHIHHTSIDRVEGRGPFVNPGPTFGSDGRDVLNPEPRGFVITEVSGGRAEPRFEALDVVPFARVEVDVAGLTASQAREAIAKRVAALDVDGKAVVLRVKGELTSGRRAEVDVDGLHASLPKLGARAVHIVKAYSIREAEPGAAAAGSPQEDVERQLLADHMAKFASGDPRFRGKSGLELALALRRLLSEEAPLQRGGGSEFEERLTARALEMLGVGGAQPVSVAPQAAEPTLFEAAGAGPPRSLEEFH